MSIYRQFWLVVVGLTLMAFSGSFLLSLFTARSYIEQQVYMKNIDNAASLALVLSQLPEKDPVAIELLIAAQFDTGHYQEITLTDPQHRVLQERHHEGAEAGAPAWFVRLFPIQAEAGQALIQDGWKQFGAIKVVSHSRFAYAELWRGVERLAFWFAFAALAAGALGTLLIRLLFRPLNKVVDQAHAIQERRFVTVDEPRTPELRDVVVAMNAMVVRLKNMFSDEAERLDELRRRINHDALTGLPNREFFLSALRDNLSSEKAASHGCLTLVRLAELEKLNASLGHLQADRLIKEFSLAIKAFADGHGNCLSARLNGSDFALLVTGASDSGKLADEIQNTLRLSVCRSWPQLEDIFHAGVAAYRHGDACGDVLSAADRALAFAESQEANAVHALDSGEPGSAQRSGEAWRSGLNEALDGKRIRLERYPVLTADNRLLHHESSARMQLDLDGAWLPAGDFMPMALRQNLSSAVDLNVVRIALDALDQESVEIAINLSAETIADWHFNDELATVLESRPETCKRLWIEVPEYGAFRNFDAFRSFCRRLDHYGCKLGIEHFGQHLGQIASLAELGLDYLKIDSRFIRDIDTNTGNQEFLRGLCRVAHNAGVQIIAEGVGTPAELDRLLTLGFDGTTGREITRRVAQS